MTPWQKANLCAKPRIYATPKSIGFVWTLQIGMMIYRNMSHAACLLTLRELYLGIPEVEEMPL